MARTRVCKCSVLTDENRKKEWQENRRCPECGSGKYDAVVILKKLKSGKYVGMKYVCRECNTTNQFTSKTEEE